MQRPTKKAESHRGDPESVHVEAPRFVPFSENLGPSFATKSNTDIHACHSPSDTDIRHEMCTAAARLCTEIKYTSAGASFSFLSTINKLILYVVTGTCEFIVDNQTGAYFFLELNARLQVEHTITEAVHSENGLDLVELMIRQGIAEFDAGAQGTKSCILLVDHAIQSNYVVGIDTDAFLKQ